jgi:hypothetical protein
VPLPFKIGTDIHKADRLLVGPAIGPAMRLCRSHSRAGPSPGASRLACAPLLTDRGGPTVPATPGTPQFVDLGFIAVRHPPAREVPAGPGTIR